MAASKFERETKEKADKEIADKRKADEEAAHKEAIFNIEEEARLEANAEKTKFEREIRNAKNALEERKRVQQTALGSEGDILGASAAGRQALDVARKQREQQLKTENFKTAEAIAPTQRDREKMAAQQVAGEMPSLAERIQGGISGVDPSQLARMGALSKFEKDRSFPKGGATETAVGHLGYEKSSLSEETLQAIMSLVDLMKSGTVVQ
jgi:hypothetical protein